MVKISNKRLKKLRQAQSESSQKQHYRMYKAKKNWVTAGVVTAALFGGFGMANSSVHADNVSPDVVNVQKNNTSTDTASSEETPTNNDATKVVAPITNNKGNEADTSTTQAVQQPSTRVTTNAQSTLTPSTNQETTTSNPATKVTDDVTPKTDTTSANTQTEQPKTTNKLAVSRVATPEEPTPATQTGDSNPNMDLHQTTAGKTYTTPEYVAKKSSIEAYIDNPGDFDNGVTKDLNYSSSTNFNVKGDFTIDGSLLKKDRTILLGTIVTSNNFYNDPWVKNHDQNIGLDHNAPQTITYKGKTIGFIQFENPTVNGQKIQNEFDWMLHVTSDDEWTEDVTISAYIYRVIRGGYFTDMEVYHDVTKNNPWVETFSTPNHSYTATYKVPNFDKTNWDAGHNYLRGNDRNNGLAKYAPAIQTSDQTPLNTLINSGGKKAPSDAKLSGYKFVTKISGLGLPTHFSSTSREMHILVVDQNGRVTNEDLAFYSNAGDWNPYKANVSDWHIKEVENNLTAQQLYDRVKNNETLVSRQNDGTILIANGVGVDALEMTDDFITNYVKSSSVQYAIANATDRQKILDNTLAFYHGPLKNTAALAFVHNFMSNDDPNGIVDRKIEDVTPSASRRQNAGPLYQRYHLYDASGKGDLLQHEYVYYIDADAGNTVFKKDDLSGKAGEKKGVVVNAPKGYVLDQKLTGSIPTSYTLKDGSNEPIKVYFRHRVVELTPERPRDLDGLRESDLNKTITRTIKVTNPDGKVNTTPQTVKLTRTATLDEASGKITYSDWTTGQFDAFQVPGIKGYTPSQPQVDQMAVTVDTTDQTVEVTYTANPQSTKVNYVDPDGTPVHSTPITGHTDETVKVPDETPAGWHVVNKGDLPGELTFTAEGHPEVNVPIEHSHTTVTPDDPKTPSDKLPDNPDKSYPEGVGKDDLNKTITRTIVVTDPTGKKATTEQKVNLTRTADVDEVTGEVTYGDWTTGSFEAFEVPAVKGYTPSQAKVDEETVTADTQNQTVEVTYTANPQSTKVNYVDPDGTPVHSTPITGHTDETVKVPDETPTGWHVVNKDDLPGEITFTPDGHPEVNVPIEHSHTTVTPDDPKIPSDKLPDNPDKDYPEGVGQDDLNKTVTRTIVVTDPTGKKDTTEQKVNLTRQADVDEVTGEVTYGDWTTGKFEDFEVPAVKGYTPSQAQVDEQTVTADTKDQMVEVTYTANPQSTKVNYVDPDGTPVHSTPITGHTDETVKVPDETPAGWHVVNKGDLPGELTFTPDGHPEVNVEIEHSHTTVTPDDPKTPSDKLPDNPDKSYPEGVGQDDLNKTVTRTINFHLPSGKVVPGVQKVQLTRTADVDEVTGEVTYGDWSEGKFNAFDVPSVKGYTPSQPKIEEMKVTGDTKDQVIDVTYSADPQSTKVNYVDPDGKPVHSTPITGHTDETVKVSDETPAGWHVVNKDDLPGELTFTPDGHPEVNVEIEHSHTTVTPDDPKTPSDKLPDNPDKNYPEGVGQDDLNKTITRTIVVTDPTGKKSTTEQKVHLTRQADVDEVTGEVTYGEWTTGNFEAFEVPAVDGYTPSQAKVDEETVTADTKDQTVEVNYKANDQGTKINYVDPNGEIIHSTPVTGHTGETVKVPNEVPSGWHVVNKDDLPGELTFTSDGHPEVNVKIEHSHTTVTPDDPKMPGDKLPDNPDKNYPAGVGQDDLNRTVTRTIVVTNPDGTKDTTEQKVHLTRQADVDEVTGEVTYSDWTTGEFEAFEVPAIKGYTPSQAQVDEQTVTADTQNQTVEITYTANEQTIKITYVDKDGNVVHTTTVTGHTDETVEVPNELPNGWHIVDGDLPKTITFSADGNQDITIKIAKDQAPVVPTQKPAMTATAMTPEQMVDQVVKKVNAEEAAKAASLPQTGDKSDETTALIGASLAGVGALLGLVGTRRKKED